MIFGERLWEKKFGLGVLMEEGKRWWWI